MQELIRATINRLYLEKDYDFYLEKCKAIFSLSAEFESLLKSPNLRVIEQTGIITPVKRWTIKYPAVTKGEFEATFSSSLLISKLVPYYYLQHEFEVQNKDEKRMTPQLDGFDCTPYNMDQFNFEEKMNEMLCNLEYSRLSYLEFNEVIPELEFPEGVQIFGKQVTVEYALFHDLLDLCEE